MTLSNKAAHLVHVAYSMAHEMESFAVQYSKAFHLTRMAEALRLTALAVEKTGADGDTTTNQRQAEWHRTVHLRGMRELRLQIIAAKEAFTAAHRTYEAPSSSDDNSRDDTPER